MESVKDQPSQQPTARQLARQLATLTARHGHTLARRAVTTDRDYVAVGTLAIALALANNQLPLVLAIVVDVTMLSAVAHWLLIPWLRTGLSYRDRQIQTYLDGLYDRAGITPRPTTRRKGSRLDVRGAAHSWTIELDVGTDGTGIRSARDFCARWPALKTEAGEGCVGVYLHEGRGRHVTLVIVWERDRGDRTVRIGKQRAIVVKARRSPLYPAWSQQLGGWVEARHEHAGEWYGNKDDADRPLTLDDWTTRTDHVTEEPDQGDEPEADDLEQPESYDPAPEVVMWPPIRPAQGPESGCNEAGGGAEPTTPPESPSNPFAAPPVGPPMSGLFSPTVTVWAMPARPLNARAGTATGAVWDALMDGLPHSRADLAELSGMTPASVGNALTGWARLGIVDHDGDGWRAVVSQQRAYAG